MSKPWSNDSELAFYNLLEVEDLCATEGSRGVSNLCKLVRLLGYQDPMHFGHLSQGGIIGDLTCFLEDNPGAISAIHDWIANNSDSFDPIKDYLDLEEEDEDEEDDD